jgi:ABC-type multidrug transport system ATPase subunit
MQADHLLPCLSVRETLEYAARLRLPASMPDDERLTRVQTVIGELGLSECADTLIGGTSGGQKRRTTIGVQLLTDPNVLLLDEVSSHHSPLSHF